MVDDINDAAYANQKRMNSNPFEGRVIFGVIDVVGIVLILIDFS